MDLEARIEALEETQRILDQEMAPVEQRHKMIREAMFQALLSLVLEMAGRLGISEERFEGSFQERVRWYHDRNLQTASGISPNLAGQIDDRDLSDVPTEGFPTPLFPKGE